MAPSAHYFVIALDVVANPYDLWPEMRRPCLRQAVPFGRRSLLEEFCLQPCGNDGRWLDLLQCAVYLQLLQAKIRAAHGVLTAGRSNHQ